MKHRLKLGLLLMVVKNVLQIHLPLLIPRRKPVKRNPYLRVKIKSLAAEAGIIRHEERIANKRRDFDLQNSLSEHRKRVVRREARSTLLAYQYLRGVPYAVCEKPNYSSTKNNRIDWESVERMVSRYGNGKTKLNHEEWTRVGLVSRQAS